MSVYRAFMSRKGVSIPARASAKGKTVVQDLVLGLCLLPPMDQSSRRARGGGLVRDGTHTRDRVAVPVSTAGARPMQGRCRVAPRHTGPG